MREFSSREQAGDLQASLLNGSSFLKRVRENLQGVWRVPLAPLPAAHAPIHLLDERRARTTPAAQVGSTLVHLSICLVLLWSVTQPTTRKDPPASRTFGPLEFSAPKWLQNEDSGSLGKSGSGGGRDSLPPTVGEIVPASRFALVAPHLPDARPHSLTTPVAVPDPDAPDFVRVVTDPGLPWMKDRNNSEGQGEHGIGRSRDHGMGDGPGDGSGVGNDHGPYSAVATQVICRVCPDPLYSEEARKTKLQGSVMLSVLVGADGRVKDVRVLHGIGMGLDENAIQMVRTWQFIPAKDAARRPIESWIQVETLFRLY